MQVMQSLVDLGALQPTGDMSAVSSSPSYPFYSNKNKKSNSNNSIKLILFWFLSSAPGQKISSIFPG